MTPKARKQVGNALAQVCGELYPGFVWKPVQRDRSHRGTTTTPLGNIGGTEAGPADTDTFRNELPAA